MIALMYCFASKADIQLYIHMCGHIAVCFQVVNCKMSPICKRLFAIAIFQMQVGL